MKILLRNTVHGLIPLYDDDYEEKKKLKVGVEYKAEIKLARNISFHRKYFGMLDAAWYLLTERQRMFFTQSDRGETFGKEAFRRTVQVTAGYFDPIFDLKEKRWQKSVRSIAFDRMDEAEFEKLYHAVYDVVMDILATNGTSKDQFDQMIDNFQ
jgi:hypothetical protein